MLSRLPQWIKKRLIVDWDMESKTEETAAKRWVHTCSHYTDVLAEGKVSHYERHGIR